MFINVFYSKCSILKRTALIYFCSCTVQSENGILFSSFFPAELHSTLHMLTHDTSYIQTCALLLKMCPNTESNQSVRDGQTELWVFLIIVPHWHKVSSWRHVSVEHPHTICCWSPYIHRVSVGPYLDTKTCCSPFTHHKLPTSPSTTQTPTYCLSPSLLRKTQWLTLTIPSSAPPDMWPKWGSLCVFQCVVIFSVLSEQHMALWHDGLKVTDWRNSSHSGNLSASFPLQQTVSRAIKLESAGTHTRTHTGGQMPVQEPKIWASV